MWMVGRGLLPDCRVLPSGGVWLQAIQARALLSSAPVLQVENETVRPEGPSYGMALQCRSLKSLKSFQRCSSWA